MSVADADAVRRILTDTLFGLWATVDNLSRLRPSRRERYRVTVFGSARTEPGHWVCREVKRMCAALSGMGCDIVTGGGPGLMQAANEGALEAPLPPIPGRQWHLAVDTAQASPGEVTPPARQRTHPANWYSASGRSVVVLEARPGPS